jgi:hypothetical protein
MARSLFTRRFVSAAPGIVAQLLVGLLTSSVLLAHSPNACANPPQSLAELRDTVSAANARIAALQGTLTEHEEQLGKLEMNRAEMEGALNAARQALTRLRMQQVSSMYGADWQKFFASEAVRNLNYDGLIQLIEDAKQKVVHWEQALANADQSQRHIEELRNLASDQLAQAKIERARIYLEASDANTPVVLDELKIADDRNELLYHAKWTDPPADPAAVRLAVIRALMDRARYGEKVLLVQYADAEKRLRDADAQWHALDADIIQKIYADYVLRIALELADSAVSVASAGEGAPAALVYELGYRLYEASRPGAGRRPYPTLPEEMIALRDKLATSLSTGAEVSMADVMTADVPLRTHVARNALLSDVDNQIGELTKNAVEAGFAFVREKGDEWLSRRVLWPELSRGGSLGELVDTLYVLSVTAHRKAAAEGEWFKLFTGGAQVLDGVYDTLFATAGTRWATQGDKLVAWFDHDKVFRSHARDLVKGAVLGIAVTGTKDAALLWHDAAIAEKYLEQARIELEWFVRRNELHAARELLQWNRKFVDRLAAEADALIYQRCQCPDCCKRRLEVIRPVQPLACARALLVSKGARHVKLTFHTNHPITGASAEARLHRDGQRARLASPLAPDSADGRRLTGRYDHGGAREALRSGFTVEFGTGASGPGPLDADPATVAYLDIDLNWVGLEAPPDSTHSVAALVAPELAFANELADRTPVVAPGGPIPIRYVAPYEGQSQVRIAAFPLNAPTATTVGADVSQIFIDGPTSGNHRAGTDQLFAPLEPGPHEARLFDRQTGIVWDRVNFLVEATKPPEPSSARDVAMRVSESSVVVGESLRIHVALPDGAGDLKPSWPTSGLRLRQLATGYEWDLHPDLAALTSGNGIEVTAHDLPGDYLIYYRHDGETLASAIYQARVTPTPGVLAFATGKTVYRPGETVPLTVTPPAGRYYAIHHWAPLVSMAATQAGCKDSVLRDVYLDRGWKIGEPNRITFEAPAHAGIYEFTFFDRNMKSYALDTLRMTVVAGSTE